MTRSSEAAPAGSKARSRRWRSFIRGGGVELVLPHRGDSGLVVHPLAEHTQPEPLPALAPFRSSSPPTTSSGRGSCPTTSARRSGGSSSAAPSACLLGIPFGIALGLNRTVSDMFYPIMNFFQSISGIAILPIIVVWWGQQREDGVRRHPLHLLFPHRLQRTDRRAQHPDDSGERPADARGLAPENRERRSDPERHAPHRHRRAAGHRLRLAGRHRGRDARGQAAGWAG